MEPRQSELLLIGRVYAIALYDAALAAGKLEAILDDIAGLRAILAATPRLSVFLKAATISAPEKLKMLDGVLSGSAEGLTLAVLRAMARRDRLNLLPEFVVAFDLVRKERANQVSLEVVSAVALDGGQREQIRAAVAKAVGREVELKLSVNPALLGGVQFRLGDLLVDGSTKYRIASMKAWLHAELSASLQPQRAMEA